MISKREALVVGFVTVAGVFGALAAGAAVVGQAFEQLANAFSDADMRIAVVESDAERQPMGFTA